MLNHKFLNPTEKRECPRFEVSWWWMSTLSHTLFNFDIYQGTYWTRCGDVRKIKDGIYFKIIWVIMKAMMIPQAIDLSMKSSHPIRTYNVSFVGHRETHYECLI